MSTHQCAHCARPMRGSASVAWGTVRYNLCHPDTGMDCYRLVTIYKHRVVNCPCAANGTEILHMDLMRPAPGIVRCCICFEARRIDELLEDQSTGQRWDLCSEGKCAEQAGVGADGKKSQP